MMKLEVVAMVALLVKVMALVVVLVKVMGLAKVVEMKLMAVAVVVMTMEMVLVRVVEVTTVVEMKMKVMAQGLKVVVIVAEQQAMLVVEAPEAAHTHKHYNQATEPRNSYTVILFSAPVYL